MREQPIPVQAAPLNQPTWTGRSGGSGAPASARFGAATNLRLARAVASPGNTPSSSSQQPPPQAEGGAAAGGGGGGAEGAAAGAGFGGALAGTTGGIAPRSSVLLARLRERAGGRERRRLVRRARNDPEVLAYSFGLIPVQLVESAFHELGMVHLQIALRLNEILRSIYCVTACLGALEACFGCWRVWGG